MTHDVVYNICNVILLAQSHLTVVRNSEYEHDYTINNNNNVASSPSTLDDAQPVSKRQLVALPAKLEVHKPVSRVNTYTGCPRISTRITPTNKPNSWGP